MGVFLSSCPEKQLPWQQESVWAKHGCAVENCVRNGADSQFTEPPLLQFCHITHFIFYPYTLHGSLSLILCLFSGACFVISLHIDWHVCSSVGWSRAELYVYARWTNLLMLGHPHPPSPWARPSQKPFLSFFHTETLVFVCWYLLIWLQGQSCIIPKLYLGFTLFCVLITVKL